MVRKKIEFEVNENGCFICISHAKDRFGHIIYRNDGYSLMHRFIYEQCFGKIKEGLVIRHKCDNPSCINPEHLEIGTHRDNVNDKVKRGRSTYGEKNPKSKLTEDEVREIRNNKILSVRELSEKYSVTMSAIRQIINYTTWKHIE